MGKYDLTGRRFGMLTVEGDSGERKAGCVLWRCRCDCGGEILAKRYELESGNAVSCGCVERQYASHGRAEDLTGRRFGRLTALRRAEGPGIVRWVCRCDCGKETVVSAIQLKTGRTRSCGCLRNREALNSLDLTGQRFGRLTALYRVPDGSDLKKAMWRCRCDCGKETDVYAWSLLKGVTKSCGCLNREVRSKMHEHMHYQNDTCAEVLRQACADTGERKSKAGFRGLYLLESGKYRVMITFQGKHYNLGHYSNFEDAVRARLDAEEIMHEGYLKALENYEGNAKACPAWAEANPFYYTVTRVNGSFIADTNGWADPSASSPAI